MKTFVTQLAFIMSFSDLERDPSAEPMERPYENSTSMWAAYEKVSNSLQSVQSHHSKNHQRLFLWEA